MMKIKAKFQPLKVKAVATIPALVSAATTALKDLLALKLNLSEKELKWFQDMRGQNEAFTSSSYTGGH